MHFPIIVQMMISMTFKHFYSHVHDYEAFVSLIHIVYIRIHSYMELPPMLSNFVLTHIVFFLLQALMIFPILVAIV